MSNDENFLIEGIGNEVLVFLTAFVAVVSLVSYFTYQRFMSFRINTNHSNQQAQNNAQRIALMSNRLTGEETDSSTMTQPRHYGSDQQCPVCLAEPRYPVETNCGHLFCGQCIIDYWRYGNWLGAVRCPVCRQSVTAVMTCFREDQTTNSPERTQLINGINEYNRRYSGEPRPWLDYLWDLPTLLRHAGSEFFSFGGIMYMFRLRILLCFVAAIMYLISPLDMIPEAVFGILGLLDDMFVLLLVAIYVTVIYRRFLASRWQNQ